MKELLVNQTFVYIVIWFWAIILFRDTASDENWKSKMLFSIVIWFSVAGWFGHLMTEAPTHFLAVSVFWIGTSFAWKFWRSKKPDLRFHNLLTAILKKVSDLAFMASLGLVCLYLISSQKPSMLFALVLGGAIALFFIVVLYRPVLRCLNRLSDNYKM